MMGGSCRGSFTYSCSLAWQGTGSCAIAVQGVADIDRAIEAASLGALAAQSRLNSALTSVYAKAPAPPQATAKGAAAEGASAGMTAQNGQMLRPAGAGPVLESAAAGAPAATTAQPLKASMPGQQGAMRLVDAAAHQQGAAQKEAEAHIPGTMPVRAVQGVFPGECLIAPLNADDTNTWYAVDKVHHDDKCPLEAAQYKACMLFPQSSCPDTKIVEKWGVTNNKCVLV